MWSDNPLFWLNLDELVKTAWRPLKEFLDVCIEHEDEMTLQTNALLHGGLGTFVRKYAMMRADNNVVGYHSSMPSRLVTRILIER